MSEPGMPSGLLHLLNQNSPCPWGEGRARAVRMVFYGTPSLPVNATPKLTLQALGLHAEPILTADLETQVWASPFRGLVLFVLWGWRLFLRA